MILLFLLLSVVLLSSLTHAKVRRDKPSVSGGNADDDDLSLRNRKQPLLVAETTLQLQTRQLSLRATLERDAQGRESRLRVSAELNHFADDMYLALGFNAQGRMSPSLALVGHLSRPDDNDDTPVAQCSAFWLASHDVSGISALDRTKSAIDTCTLQRGYGTVALQVNIDLATNSRLLRELANATRADASAVKNEGVRNNEGVVALPLAEVRDGVRLTFAFGPSSSSRDSAVPMQFHNEDHGSVTLAFSHEVARSFRVGEGTALLTVHIVAALGAAFVALARAVAPPHAGDTPWRSLQALRAAALIAGTTAVMRVARDARPHGTEVHHWLGAAAIFFALAGPSVWRPLLQFHPHVRTLAVLLGLAQISLGLLKIGSLLFFFLLTGTMVPVLFCLEPILLRSTPHRKGSSLRV